MRDDVNSSIMGLVAGSQMAIHLLRLTEGSDHLLAEVFPNIPHIGRLNLKTSAAREVLDSAETHLSAMAIPYVLAVHEDYMKSCLKLVERHCNTNIKAKDVPSSKQHELLQDQATKKFTSYSLEQFHLIRRMRNCMIHRGGEIDTALENHCAQLSSDAIQGWEVLTGRTPQFKVGQEKIRFGQRETVATLAITKRLARETNLILQGVIPRSAWGAIMMADVSSQTPGLPKSFSDRFRKVRGYARYYYAVLNFNDQEIEIFNSNY